MRVWDILSSCGKNNKNHFARCCMTGKIISDVKRLSDDLKVDCCFDIIKREVMIAEKKAAYFYVDGFCKDIIVQKLLEHLMELKLTDIESSKTADDFIKSQLPYTEVATVSDYNEAELAVLSGQFLIVIDGFSDGILLDTREYPTRGIVEPDKDRSLRGSRDSFSETLIFNTALIRRRIRDKDLRMEYMQIGKKTKLDVAICYMGGTVDEKTLEKLRNRLKAVKLSGVSMASQAISEVLVPTSFLNPLPRIKYTERPDYASACILEGRIALVIDNCPSVMLFATTFADFLREADDYYFPPVTASFVRISRIIVSLFTVFLTPLILLLNEHPAWIPQALDFIKPEEALRMPLVVQFLLLEFIIDGLKLASLNTPSTISNSLGIIGGLLLSEFAVEAGWFVPDTIVYISFVAIAGYAQPSLEMGYAMKFGRLFLLILTHFLSYWGLIFGTVVILLVFIFSKTLSGNGYFYPIIPFNLKEFGKLFVRPRVRNRGDE